MPTREFGEQAVSMRFMFGLEPPESQKKALDFADISAKVLPPLYFRPLARN